MDLPHCIHRGEVVDETTTCASDHFEHGEYILVDICRKYCKWVNLPRINPEGFGDRVHQFTHATGIDKLAGDCGGCGKRKKWLNRKFPKRKRKQ